MMRIKLVAIVLAAVVLIAVSAIPVLGVQSLINGNISPSDVNESTTVNTGVNVTATHINASGQSVVFYIRFPDSVSLAVNSAGAEDASGKTISISSSAEVVDGPDADSVRDTIRFGVQPDRGGAQIDITGSVNVDITYPNVSGGDVTYEVFAKVLDTNDGTTVGPVSVTSVTVQDLDSDSTIAPPTLPGFQNAPTDPDDDGVYEDVNGDGVFNIADVQALFANRNSDAVQNNQAAFDFNGDGVFNIGDVQALFAAITS